MLTIKDLNKRAKWVYQQAGVTIPIRVKRILRRDKISNQLFGFCIITKQKARVWMHLQSKAGKHYTDRFKLSVLAHELAHISGQRHTKRFRKAHRYVTMLLGRYEKG